MVWKGVIIEESLENKKLLDMTKIINTEKTALEMEEEGGILHFHHIELMDKKKDEFINKAKNSIKQGWYIHICKNGRMTVIFKDKVFEFTKKQNNMLNEARNYGLSIGIIKEQMPFEKLIENPYD